MAASIIDAFLVTMGMDTSNFDRNSAKTKKTQQDLANQSNRNTRDRETQNKKLSDAEKKRQKESEERAKKTVEGFKTVRNEVVKLATLFTAGMGFKSFVENTINGAASLGFLSANLRMTTEDISAWQHASERANGSASGMTAQFKESANTLAQLKLGFGASESLQSFFRFGGNSSDLKDGNAYLLARSKIVADMFAIDPGKAALMAREMGIVEDQFDLIKQGPEAIAKLVDAQRKNSAVSAENAAEALKLKNSWLDFTQSLQSTFMKVILALAPAITEIVAKFAEWAGQLGENKAGIQKLGDTFVNFARNIDWKAITDGAKDFAASVKSIADNLTDVINRWDEFWGKSKVQTPGVTKMVGAFRFGQRENLDIDNRATGKPVKIGPVTGGAAKSVADGIEMALARTLASFGIQSAKEFVRDNMGQDLYGAGPKKPALSAPVDGTIMDRAKYSTKKLMAMGWTQAQAAGMVGSLVQESRLDPDAVNPTSGARGIAQWLSKDRIANFEKWAGRPLKGSTLDQQLEFQNYELTKGSETDAGKRLRGTKTATEAAEVHRRYYERPGEDEANDRMRRAFATQIELSMQKGNALASTAMPVGSTQSIANRTDNSRSSTSTSDTTINGGITIVTQATDMKAAAKEIKPAIEKYNSAMQANTGIR